MNDKESKIFYEVLDVLNKKILKQIKMRYVNGKSIW